MDPGPNSGVRAVVVKTTLADQSDEVEFWADVAPENRVAAVEVLRRRVFGRLVADSGIQRVCRIVRS